VTTDVGIQRDEMPGAEVERVVAFGTVRARSEVIEVALRAGRFVLVVSGRRISDRVEMPELPVIHPQELVEPPVVVLQVTEPEEGVGSERRDERGDLVGAARALAVALAE